VIKDNYAESNREAWNEVAGIHKKNRKINYCEKFKDNKYSALDNILSSLLMKIPLEGKHVAQLFCNNGSELLSIVNTMGTSGVGFDISDEFISEAKEIAESAQLNCRFVRTDIDHLSEKYNHLFNMLLLTAGSMTWIHDLAELFKKVNGLLKPGGYLVIYEIHPFTNLFAWKGESEYDSSNPYKIAYKYFRDDPWINNNGADYIGKMSYKSKTFISFAHKLSDIITAIGANEIVIEEFMEYPHDVSAHLNNIEMDKIIPLSYTIIGRKIEL